MPSRSTSTASPQAAVVLILTPIYDPECLGFSYGFRPSRGQHNAMDALAYGIKGRNVRWMLKPVRN